MSPIKLSSMIKRKKKESKSQSKKGALIIEKRERRKHPRLNSELPLDYSKIDSNEDYGGIVANASEGGILVHLPEELEIGDVLKIEIFFAKELELNSLQGVAKVVWADLATRESWGEHRYGLQFQSIERGSLHKLKTLLKEAGKTHSAKRN